MGRFFVAESSSIHENFSIIKGEAMTLIVDAKELVSIGYTNVIFETYSKTVAYAIYHSRTGVSEFSS
jgi:hypothetical protein